MEYRVVYTKSFNGYLRGLQQLGHKKVVQAVRATMSEAGMAGEIKSVPRTKHGETRIPNVEKYDLPDAFRLIVQLVDGITKVRAFLFAGTHDDADRWLDAHKNYRWVKSANDGTLDFIQVTESKSDRHVPADRVDLDAPEDILGLPLLRVLEPAQWETLKLPGEAQSLTQGVTGEDYERDADGLLQRLDELAGWELASVVFDLLSHAHAREWNEVTRRISVHAGTAAIAQPPEVVPAMLSADNSESFIVFDDATDLDAFFRDHSLSDWMLFLHPEQKRVVEREFRGPARLRGVSGSGKTSVLVHRARFLAKKYRQPILLVTLTESLRKLLDLLADELCGLERPLIATMTMSALAKQVVHELHPHSSNFYSIAPPERQTRLVNESIEHVRAEADFDKTFLKSLEGEDLRAFFKEEFSFLRGRLPRSEFEAYLDTKSFLRRGRGVPLGEAGRRIVLEALRKYETLLAANHLLDHDGIVNEAVLRSRERPFTRFRAVLCDEVQDLSHLELALLAGLRTPDGEPVAQAENGLFLAGDGAQSIYKKGFSLKKLGVDVGGRSYLLGKNYRNTYEILRAAFGLVAAYEFADVDEENVARPSAPDFAKRHGSRPLLVKCESPRDEANFVATSVASLLAMGQTAGQICVVAPSSRLRDAVGQSLTANNVQFTDLKQDVDYDSDRVKVSTIESAKGHEFSSVYIMGLVEGILPTSNVPDEEMSREAARLYVAMTRARDTLTVSYSAGPGYPASRFLHLIQDACDEGQFRGGVVRKVS